MGDVAWVNDATIIRQNPKVSAINSCIEIDITGQVVSDSIGTRMYSGMVCSRSPCVWVRGSHFRSRRSDRLLTGRLFGFRYARETDHCPHIDDQQRRIQDRPFHQTRRRCGHVESSRPLRSDRIRYRLSFREESATTRLRADQDSAPETSTNAGKGGFRTAQVHAISGLKCHV